MPLKFCANLSTMFKTMPFHERLYEAKNLGFKYVEAQFLYDYDLPTLSSTKQDTGLEFVMINSPTKGYFIHSEEPFGLACVPCHKDGFMESIKLAVKYAKELNCPRIHIIAGKKLASAYYSDEIYENTYFDNICNAADYLNKHDMMAMIEPISTIDGYYLNSFDKAVKIIKGVNRPNVKMLLDVFHMQKMGMNVEKDLPKYLPYAGHVQVSQSPSRHEPFYPGKIDYEKVFAYLKQSYTGYIGLEYFPSESPNSLNWVETYSSG